MKKERKNIPTSIKELLLSSNSEDIELGLVLAKEMNISVSSLNKYYWKNNYAPANSEFYKIWVKYLHREYNNPGGNRPYYFFTKWKL